MNTKDLPEVFMGVVRNLKGEVLIIHRKKEEKGTGKTILSWAFPGGKANPGETKEQTVARELLEETGYRVKPGKVISEREHPNFPVYIYYLACSLEREIPEFTPTDTEVEEVKWIKPVEIPDYFTSDIDPRVREALGNTG